MGPTMTISLRPFRPEDQEFLFQLYASTRMHEIAGFGWLRGATGNVFANAI
jgi:hypothetical protein